MARFSKAQLSADVFERIRVLESTYGFTNHDGWDQVDGKGEMLNRKYGEYEQLLWLVERYNLKES